MRITMYAVGIWYYSSVDDDIQSAVGFVRTCCRCSRNVSGKLCQFTNSYICMHVTPGHIKNDIVIRARTRSSGSLVL